MPQIANPNTDVPGANDGWGVEPLWSKVRKSEPSDSPFISSPVDPVSRSFEVALDRLPVPQTPSPLKLTVRLRETASGSGWVVVTLLEGSTKINDWWKKPPTTTFGDLELTVPENRAALINDYGALRVRVSAGVPGIPTTCCPGVELPGTLAVTFVGGPCGRSWPIVWNGSVWAGEVTGTSTAVMRLTCLGSHWQLAFDDFDSLTDLSQSCSPFELVMSPPTSLDNPCLGTGVQVRITE